MQHANISDLPLRLFAMDVQSYLASSLPGVLIRRSEDAVNAEHQTLTAHRECAR